MNNGHVQTTMPDAQQHDQPQQNTATTPAANGHSRLSAIRANARVEITEQPASKALRFRYECEGRSAGSIPGASTSGDTKTYPSIRVVGYKGRAVVVVSCVTKDAPHRPHPHNLVGKEGCKKGVCTVEINNETMSVSFSNLGIQCVKKRDIEDALRCREEIRVDPFRTGFSHRAQPSSIDLNSVRLCFQVFLESEVRGRFTVPLVPVVSEPIFDKKAMSDLVICKLSDASGSVAGGKDMILLCEKVAKEDIAVRFYEESDGVVVWEGFGDFQHANVHKQVAISFRTPRYRAVDIDRSVNCFVQLKRPSDGITSESLPYEYYPLDSDTTEGKRKRPRIQANPGVLYGQLTAGQQGNVARNIVGNTFDFVGNLLDQRDAYIKSEPRDTLSPHQQQRPQNSNNNSPMHPSPSCSPYYNYPQQQQPYTPNIPCDQLNPANNNFLQPLGVGHFFAQQQPAQLAPAVQLQQPELKSINIIQSPAMQYEANVTDQKPNNIPAAMQREPSPGAGNCVAVADSADAINISGLLRELDSNMQFSGELGLSLSFLEGAAGSTNVAPQQQQQHPAPNAGMDGIMEPENMTDSFNKFNLQN